MLELERAVAAAEMKAGQLMAAEKAKLDRAIGESRPLLARTGQEPQEPAHNVSFRDTCFLSDQ
jgi:hypothetical protein